ncbi:carbohydrate ABC transporter permease [Spirillospora sp. CA-294931]|uniref:carbohydrate ABC transporter permease n=1 Tax=Spirillospora sp. CA-294931 TaxID=3240042 RepID=UPI003D90EEDB
MRDRLDLTPYVFVAAALVYLLVFMGVPIGTGVRLGFTETDTLDPTGGTYIGWDNYAEALRSSAFGHTLWATLVYTAASVAVSMALGLAAALAVNGAFRGRAVARAVLVAPWAAPTIAVTLIFAWMFNNSNGVFNAMSGSPVGWLTDPDWAMASVVAVTVWKLFPFCMLVVLAALQGVPEELYEAARVDGADPLNVFKQVTVPAIAPTLRVLALLMTIWSFRRFELIWLLTGGGPADTTNTVVIDVFREAFTSSRLGMSAAIGSIGLALSLMVTLGYLALDRRAREDR